MNSIYDEEDEEEDEEDIFSFSLFVGFLGGLKCGNMAILTSTSSFTLTPTFTFTATFATRNIAMLHFVTIIIAMLDFAKLCYAYWWYYLLIIIIS